jgi:hypothetical protein
VAYGNKAIDRTGALAEVNQPRRALVAEYQHDGWQKLVVDRAWM